VHEPDIRVQEDGVNVPPPIPSLHDMELVGVFCEFIESVTFAVTVTCPPEDIVDVDDVTMTDVIS